MKNTAALCILIATGCAETYNPEPVATELMGWTVTSQLVDGEVYTEVTSDDGQLMATSDYAPAANRWTLALPDSAPVQINDPKRVLEPLTEEMLPRLHETVMAALIAGRARPVLKNRTDCYDKHACLWVAGGWQCTNDCSPIGQCNDGPHIGKMCDYCQTHDVCYIENNCSASLFTWLGITGSDECHNCDNAAIFDALSQGCDADSEPMPELN